MTASFERINPDIAGRPQLIRGNTQLLFAGMRVSENCVLNIKNKSYSVTANIDVPESGANGVIVTQGGSVGGWTLYAHEGKLKYCYNFFGIEHYIVEATEERFPRASIRCGWNSPTTVAVSPRAATSRCTTTVKPSATGRVEQTIPMALLADEACDVGRRHRLAGFPDYGPTGQQASPVRSTWVQIDIGEDSHDHLITPEERLQHRDGQAVSGARLASGSDILLCWRRVVPSCCFRPQVSRLGFDGVWRYVFDSVGVWANSSPQRRLVSGFARCRIRLPPPTPRCAALSSDGVGNAFRVEMAERWETQERTNRALMYRMFGEIADPPDESAMVPAMANSLAVRLRIAPREVKRRMKVAACTGRGPTAAG